MRAYTTATQTLTVQGRDLTGCKVWVTYSQRRSPTSKSATVVMVEGAALSVTKSGSDTVIGVTLSQEQSGQLVEGVAEVQVNWMTSGGIRDATDAIEIAVDKNLLKRVLSYG